MPGHLAHPRLVTTHQVGGSVQAEAAQGVGHQARAVALVADHDHAKVRGGRLGDPVRAGRVEPPLQHVAVDDHRPGQLAVAETLLDRAGVDHEGAVGGLGCEVARADPVQVPAAGRQQVLDRAHLRHVPR